MDISAIVLNKLLSSQDLESFSRIKLSFLDPAYSSVFSAINRHYTKYSLIPSFEDLDMTLREGQTKNTLEAIRLTDAPEVSIDVAIDALIDQYTQNEAIKQLDRFVDKITVLDTTEIKDSLAAIVLTLDEKTLSTEGVSTMDSFMLFQHDEERSRNRVMLGINNDFDAAIGGIARQEYLMIGGQRGSGKSLISANIMASQYEAGYTCPYFSIEMTGRETIERVMAILADVDYQELKFGKLSQDDLLKVVKVRAGMFLDADDLVEKYKADRDKFKFEETLVRTKELKPEAQLIVIDDRNLTLTSIDIHMGKLKAKFGDKLTGFIVDYLNQVHLEGSGTGNFTKYDWKPQVEVSTGLKNFARKYDCFACSPYQIDANGEARFAKGILDPADIAVVMEAHEKEHKCIGFKTTKIRGAGEQSFTSGMNWKTLRVSPVSVNPPEKKKKEKKEKEADEPKPDGNGNVPW